MVEFMGVRAPGEIRPLSTRGAAKGSGEPPIEPKKSAIREIFIGHLRPEKTKIAVEAIHKPPLGRPLLLSY